jgi:hypothetical protein
MTEEHEQQRDRSDDRNNAVPLLRSWWAELPVSAKVLVPLTGAILVFVTFSAIPLPLSS